MRGSCCGSGSNNQGLWLFNTLVASFVILILYDQVRPWIEETTAKLLFRQRFELREVLRQLLRVLRTTISIDDMREHVLQALSNSGRAGQVAIYLATDIELSFQLFGFRGAQPPSGLEPARPASFSTGAATRPTSLTCTSTWPIGFRNCRRC